MNKSNPFEQGKRDAITTGISANPFTQNDPRWAIYNQGFNLNHPTMKGYFREQIEMQKAGRRT